MKIAVIAGLFTERNMEIDAGHIMDINLNEVNRANVRNKIMAAFEKANELKEKPARPNDLQAFNKH